MKNIFWIKKFSILFYGHLFIGQKLSKQWITYNIFFKIKTNNISSILLYERKKKKKKI